MKRSRRYALVLLPLLAALALAVAACGGDDDEAAPAPPAAEEPAAPAEEPAAASTADVEYAQSQIDKFKQLPEFVAPGPAFDASKAAGKTVFNIPLSSEVPFLQVIDEAMMQVADTYGINFIEFPTQGQPSQWVQGIDQAIAQGVDVIVLQGAPDPRVLQPQLEQAKAAGIPVIITHIWDETVPLPPNVTASVSVPFKTAARLEADFQIADSNGDANVLIVTSSEVVPSDGIVEAIQDEFATRCPDCKTKVVNVPVVDWATKIQTEVQSAIVADPDLNYVIPIYDSMSQFAVPGVEAADAADRVSIATFNGTPFVLQFLQEGSPVKMDVGENLSWIGWANMDQVMRVLAGEPPVLEPPVPEGQSYLVLRVFDEANIDETGTPPEVDQGYGNAYIDGYTELWGGGAS